MQRDSTAHRAPRAIRAQRWSQPYRITAPPLLPGASVEKGEDEQRVRSGQYALCGVS